MSRRSFSPLLLLCALSAAALNVYAALDPTGVYEAYLDKLDRLTPPVAAVADALSDGVYPWSEPASGPEPLPAPEPMPEPLPEPEPEPALPFTTYGLSRTIPY